MPHPSDTSQPVASLNRVHTTARPGEAALHDVSLAVGRGEILTVLGAGSGASGIATVLALFAGFARARSGEVMIGGRLMDATPTHRRGIGMVARGLALFPHLDVAGHAAFAPGATPAQANAILQQLDLSGFARRRPETLMPETRLRVALARALAPAPKLLLLEEPFSVLPTAASQALKSLLRGIAADTELAIVHATDDAPSSYGLSDRVAVIQAGVLRQTGTPTDLYERPETLAVASAMGALNKLAGTVIDSDDDIARIRLSGGAVVEARTADPLRDGEACVVALRPERIAVAADIVGEMGEGALSVRLVERVFGGDQIRLRFRLDTTHGPAPELVVTRPSGAILPLGETMSLAWQPHHAHAFRTEAA